MAFGYWVVIIVTLILGVSTQAHIKNVYKKYSRVPLRNPASGSDCARAMLQANGLGNIPVNVISGSLTDNFDPKKQTLNLSREVYSGMTVSSMAVACHEAGHAVQHAQGYAPASFRMALVPVVNFATNIWIFVLLAGMFFNLLGLIYVGIALFAFAVVFQLVTLPVEYDASHRAIATLQGWGLPQDEVAGARKVLSAAALTYVAAALSSILQLLYFIGMTRD